MSKVVIIAEAGVNHNGDIELAKKLVVKAAQAGADYVKFQLFDANKLVSKSARKAEYQIVNTKNSDSQLSMLQKLELTDAEFLELRKVCKENKIGFLASPFDIDGVGTLYNWGIDYFKIPSGEITNLPYLREMAKYDLPIILSTGMCNLSEVKDALEIFKDHKVIVLHCNTEYPTPMDDVNLRAMNTMAEEFNVEIGYSDHTLGIEVPIAAVALGATMIEKHFTLSKDMDGPDHAASLEPDELLVMVKSIRNIEAALGSKIKEPSKSERKNINRARKSIVALTSIKKGEVLSHANITVKRPGEGLSPMLWDEVLGSKAIKDFEEDENIII